MTEIDEQPGFVTIVWDRLDGEDGDLDVLPSFLDRFEFFADDIDQYEIKKRSNKYNL